MVVGVVAAALGIARLGLIGWLLGLVFTGATFEDLVVPFVLVAGLMVVRGGVEYYRTMVAHLTASSVQQRLRQKLYDQVVRLGPAHFGRQRTGDVILTVVEGVEQLETYFGQYLPQFFCRRGDANPNFLVRCVPRSFDRGDATGGGAGYIVRADPVAPARQQT